MGKIAKRVLVVIGAIILALLLLVGGYAIYLMVTYDRIVDNQPVEIANNETNNNLIAA